MFRIVLHAVILVCHGLAGLVLTEHYTCCYACRHNDLKGHNFWSTIYILSIMCLEKLVKP